MRAFDVIRHGGLAEEVLTATLGPGLRLYVVPKRGFVRKYAAFATRYGSIDRVFRLSGEEPVTMPDGIAHFLEHQLFAMEDGDALDHFARLGASANAFTTYTTTTYLFSATEGFDECLSYLVDFVQTPYFRPEGVEKERGIIEQEILMYRDHPHWRLSDNLREALFHRHPVRVDIAGTVESVRRITSEQLERCYRTFYHPANMVLSVVGDVDPERVAAVVEDRLARRRYPPQAGIERLLPDEPATVARREVREVMAVSRPMVLLGFKDTWVPVTGRQRLCRDLLTELALEGAFGLGSDLYRRLYEEGLVDDSFTFSYMGDETYGMTTVGGETDDPERLTAALLDGIEDLRRRGLTDDDWVRLRNRLYGELLGHFDSLEAIAYLCNEAHFGGWRPFDAVAELATLDLEAVNRRLREHLDPDRHARSLILPAG
ncbi:MAG: insulinase family protein [Clostridia bacterium]|nr:insulinase family protein [Clostridia bacterium]